ncbi:MAG: hypothetical protein OEN56_11120 [Gemmatimonadota bacterium]|nr:hypothetical protein [Gemmatimonadota bacterium]
MHASKITQDSVDRANELYWSSARSVNKIAEELDLSKGALYGIIAPEPSGRGCPLCGDEVAYPNRTAKERKLLDCPTCDWDGGPDETIALDPDDEGGAARHGANGRQRADAPDRDATGRAEPDRDATGSEFEPDQDATGSEFEPDRDRPGSELEPTPADRAVSVPPPPYIRPAASTVAGGALLGAAVGLALVLWARRR